MLDGYIYGGWLGVETYAEENDEDDDDD